MTPGAGSQPTRSLHSRIVVLAVLGIVALSASAVFVVATAPPRADPDIAFADITWAELTPPGSAILESRGDRPPPGKNLVGRRLWVGSNGSEDEIKAFYSALLDGRPGWVPDGSTSGLRTTAEVDACTWHSDELTVRIGLRDMGGWRELHASDRGWAAVFSIEVLDSTSDKVATSACLTER